MQINQEKKIITLFMVALALLLVLLLILFCWFMMDENVDVRKAITHDLDKLLGLIRNAWQRMNYQVNVSELLTKRGSFSEYTLENQGDSVVKFLSIKMHVIMPKDEKVQVFDVMNNGHLGARLAFWEFYVQYVGREPMPQKQFNTCIVGHDDFSTLQPYRQFLFLSYNTIQKDDYDGLDRLVLDAFVEKCKLVMEYVHPDGHVHKICLDEYEKED